LSANSPAAGEDSEGSLQQPTDCDSVDVPAVQLRPPALPTTDNVENVTDVSDDEDEGKNLITSIKDH